MNIAPDLKMADYLSLRGELESEDLHGADHYADELVNEFTHRPEAVGAELPWGKTHGLFRLRPGEVTLHGGINGHRKSAVTGQIALWLAQHQRVVVASLEMKPSKTLKRMARQAAGAANPPEEFLRTFTRWADDRILIYDRLDTTPVESVLGLCYYAAKELQVNQVFIDSLAKLGIGEDDYNKQREIMDLLAVCARQTGLHIHLIHHIRKGIDEYRVPGKFDLKGSGGLSDLADNVVIHWANKAKFEAQEKQEIGQTLTQREEESLQECDQLLAIEKQRHGEWEGKFYLWVDRPSFQFTATQGPPMPFNIGYARAAA